MRERCGSLLIDALISIAIFGLIVAAFSSGIFQGQQGTVRGGNRTRAIFLAEEGLQAVRAIRDRSGGFALIQGSTNPSYLRLVNGEWQLTSTPSQIDGIFTRTITIEQIASNVLHITSLVTWSEPLWEQSRRIALQTFVTNWREDPPPPPPPAPDWSSPILTGSVLYTAASQLEEATLEDVVVQGNYAFAADSSSAGHGLIIYNITNINSPSFHSAVSVASAFDVAARGNYAYLATADPANELKILDISVLPGSVTCCVNEIDLGDTASARGIAIAGTGLFLVRARSTAPELYVFDIADNPTNPPIVATYESDTDGARDIFAVTATGRLLQPYAYMATNHLTQELTVVSVTGATMTGGGDAQGGGNPQKGVAIVVHHTGAFLGVEGDSACEVFSFDGSSSISEPAPGTACGGNQTYDLGGDSDASESANDFAVGEQYSHLFIATDTQRGGVNHYLHILSISDVNDISSSSKKIYDGNITAGYESDNGAFYRESDHTLFMVGGEEFSPGSDLIILVPTY
jgi:hypothetical protein